MEISRINSVQNQNFGAKFTQDFKTLLYEKAQDANSYGKEKFRDSISLLKKELKGTIDVKDTYLTEIMCNPWQLRPYKSIYLKENDISPAKLIARIEEMDNDEKFYTILYDCVNRFIKTENNPENAAKNKEIIDIIG